MKRRLYTLAVAASFLLFVATVAMWVRGYWVSDQVIYHRTTALVGETVLSSRGQILLAITRERPANAQDALAAELNTPPVAVEPPWVDVPST